MTLEVEICTYGLAGLQRVAQMTLPAVEGVRYRICMQNPDGAEVSLPEALRRPDVDFFQHPTRGLSINRNAALDRAEADIILIADDDLHYRAEGLRAIIDTFAADHALDFATFQYSGPDAKVYPTEACDLRDPLPCAGPAFTELRCGTRMVFELSAYAVGRSHKSAPAKLPVPRTVPTVSVGLTVSCASPSEGRAPRRYLTSAVVP